MFGMGSVLPALSFLLMLLAGWVNRQQLIVIEFLQAENRVVAQLSDKVSLGVARTIAPENVAYRPPLTLLPSVRTLPAIGAPNPARFHRDSTSMRHLKAKRPPRFRRIDQHRNRGDRLQDLDVEKESHTLYIETR